MSVAHPLSMSPKPLKSAIFSGALVVSAKWTIASTKGGDGARPPVEVVDTAQERTRTDTDIIRKACFVIMSNLFSLT